MQVQRAARREPGSLFLPARLRRQVQRRRALTFRCHGVPMIHANGSTTVDEEARQ